MNNKYTYEVTDTGKYYYENNVRIFPEQFWHIIKKLEHKIEELDFELKECKERKLYSRRELERENNELKQQIKHSQKRTAIISGWLHDEGNLTLDKYEEILDYCYQEYKKGNCE